MIISTRHCAGCFELTGREQDICWQMVRAVRDFLVASHQPDGFNINPTAGQTIPHVHIHLIPNYTGDVTNPKAASEG
jgi:diadenosine tetraphosphate (Ap4A) HIT family hydrolase